MPGEKGQTGPRGPAGPTGAPGANGLTGDKGTMALKSRRFECFPIPVTLTISHLFQDTSFPSFVDVISCAIFVKTTIGERGMAGDPGAPGIPGKPGEAGMCWL